MRITQVVVAARDWSDDALAPLRVIDPDWLLVFGDVDAFDGTLHRRLRALFPNVVLSGCSTAGEISQRGVSQFSLVITAVQLGGGAITHAQTRLRGMDDSEFAGRRIGQQLGRHAYAGVLLFAPGVEINGSALIRGLQQALAPAVPICGGLAGDRGTFTQTFVLGDEAEGSDQVVALGLNPGVVTLGHGSFGGWQPFGPMRRVTRAEGNVLYELDGESALAIYKRYLGEYADQLPASGLLFPFSMVDGARTELGLIRTILGVHEGDGALILAGEVQEAKYMQMMHARTDALVEGAVAAAESAYKAGGAGGQSLSILVSCVGRKLVMGDRVDEEVEAVAEVFGASGTLCGFYSNGEISPFLDTTECKLHNQTMTITSLYPRP
ncbi:FIST C-terminal domain-containing protein [Niveibacterium sp. 24ML]|uniref:FIST signal transduction protein n=1 Tax=Niveibacterium sp. 24ML TaxID=2985512 RepID=UPI0022711915|nr:FIST N-terminal domain-containing protein [Niveibacterium sp. 24ML]MCX9155168.1 FIST C-terminal domain-containing protein [Niveibacterium sp. 24ML]